MKTEVFSTIAYLIFGFQYVGFLMLFIRNAKSARKMALGREMLRRLSVAWRLIPVWATLAAGTIVACATGCYATVTAVTVILLPVLYHHWIISPSSIRSVSDMDDIRNVAYGKVITRGIRSRLLTAAVCANLCGFLMLHICI